MVVGTIGVGVPEEVLAAAGADVVPILGSPGDATELADRYVEPMVGARARSQLQRVLDGTYEHVDLIVFSREEDAPLRLFYVLREVRRLEPERRIPSLHLLDIQHLGTTATRRWNEDRVRELCAVVGADDDSLAEAIATSGRVETQGRPRAPPRLRHGQRARRDACSPRPSRQPARRSWKARRFRWTLRSRPSRRSRAGSSIRCSPAPEPRASSAPSAIAEDAAAAGADVVIAFYLEHDDGLRWEFPGAAFGARASAASRVILLDHQPYDLRGLELHV